MGFFDTVYCKYPLPDPRHQDLEFQTKSLERLMGTYTITRDGRLVRKAWSLRGGPEVDREAEWPIHGDIEIYTSVERDWIEYVVRFTHGHVEWIRPRPSRDVPLPAIEWGLVPKPEESAEPEAVPHSASPCEPPADAEGHTPSTPEEILLANLRRSRPELEKLLKECSSHWGYEDPIYRFYHHSFKVYHLQRNCQAIVDALQALVQDRPLHPWFLEIVRSGTGKEWKVEDNARWTEGTRPILEAFFHARYFLDMAVRYAGLEAPPQALPSGYAALLYLFGLR